jgi:hypothetical protein
MRPMPYHRFKVGQTVVAPLGGPHALIPRGPHMIVRLLPLVGRSGPSIQDPKRRRWLGAGRAGEPDQAVGRGSATEIR